MDHLGQENYKPSPVLEKALDVLFLLHADHELNASCTTVLQTGSSLVDPYSAIASVVSLTNFTVMYEEADTKLLRVRYAEPDVRHYSKCPVRYCGKLC
jgi:citrate synthase